MTLFGLDNCPGVLSLRRNLTGTDSKPIQSYLRAQDNLPLITVVADAEIAVQYPDLLRFLQLFKTSVCISCSCSCWFGE